MAISRKGHVRPDERVPVSRILPSPAAEPLVRWFWVPEWDLPPGAVHEALTLPFPACQLVVGPDGVGVHGPVTRAWRRDLTGCGWAVGALLLPGAAHALVGDVTAIRDTTTPAKGATRLLADVTTVMGKVMGGVGSGSVPASRSGSGAAGTPARHEAAARLVEQWLVRTVGPVVAGDPEAETARRLVLLADGDPQLLRVDDLAARLMVSRRSLERLARTHVGMTPAGMIRRRRLQEAAERVRTDAGADLASIAADLGYADHAHLTREFRRVLGFTPSGYRSHLTSDGRVR